MQIIRKYLTQHNITLLVLCGLVMIIMNFVVWNYIQDDGYITFHYADNLTNHGTLYYNIGMQGPYGYTNPLYVFILSTFRFLSLKLLSFEIISRIIASLSLGIIMFMLLNAKSKELWGKKTFYFLVIPFIVYVLFIFPYLLPNFFSGLETALFTLILFVLTTSLIVDSIDEKWFLLLLWAALTIRIDSLFLLMPLTVIYIVKPIKSHNRISSRIQKIIWVFAFMSAFFLLHYLLTGTFVPLSFGHKKNAFSLSTFLIYIKFSTITLLPLVIILLIRNKSFYKLVLFIIFYMLYVSFFYSFFMHWHFERYIFPFVFSIFATLLLILLRTWNKSDITNIALIGVYMLFAFATGTQQGFSWISGYRVAMQNPKYIANAFIQSKIDEKFKIYACYDAGYIAYKTGWNIIDLAGLTTPEVTREDIGQVITKRNPTVLIVSKVSYVEPTTIKLYSQYQINESIIPPNYYFVKHLPLTNKYWWPLSQYSYYVFVNENADSTLVNGLNEITIDVEKEIGYQKYIFKFLKTLDCLRL